MNDPQVDTAVATASRQRRLNALWCLLIFTAITAANWALLIYCRGFFVVFAIFMPPAAFMCLGVAIFAPRPGMLDQASPTFRLKAALVAFIVIFWVIGAIVLGALNVSLMHDYFNR